MVKRELLRILAAGAIGMIVGILVWQQTGVLYWLLSSVYGIGLLYAGMTVVKLAGGALRSYFQNQLRCLWSRPLLGTLMCFVTLAFSLSLILCIGWIIGIVRCIMAVCTAVQEDRKLNGADCDMFP